MTLLRHEGSDFMLQTLGCERREVRGKSRFEDHLSLVVPTHGHGQGHRHGHGYGHGQGQDIDMDRTWAWTLL
jgi:hypothetical protein